VPYSKLLIAVVLALFACSLGSGEAQAQGYPDAVWEVTLNKQVRLELEDGAEVTGKLLGHSDGTLVLAKLDGEIVSIEAAKVERMHVVESQLAPSASPAAPAATPAPPAPRAQERAVEHVRQIDRRTYTVGSRTVDWSEAQFVLTGFHESRATLRKGRGHLNAGIILSSIAAGALLSVIPYAAAGGDAGAVLLASTGGGAALLVGLGGIGFGIAAGADDRAIERYNRAVDRGAYVPKRAPDARAIAAHRALSEPLKARRGVGAAVLTMGGLCVIAGVGIGLDRNFDGDDDVVASIVGAVGTVHIMVGMPLVLLPPPHGLMPRRGHARAELSVGLGSLALRF